MCLVRVVFDTLHSLDLTFVQTKRRERMVPLSIHPARSIPYQLAMTERPSLGSRLDPQSQQMTRHFRV